MTTTTTTITTATGTTTTMTMCPSRRALGMAIFLVVVLATWPAQCCHPPLGCRLQSYPRRRYVCSWKVGISKGGGCLVVGVLLGNGVGSGESNWWLRVERAVKFGETQIREIESDRFDCPCQRTLWNCTTPSCRRRPRTPSSPPRCVIFRDCRACVCVCVCVCVSQNVKLVCARAAASRLALRVAHNPPLTVCLICCFSVVTSTIGGIRAETTTSAERNDGTTSSTTDRSTTK